MQLTQMLLIIRCFLKGFVVIILPHCYLNLHPAEGQQYGERKETTKVSRALYIRWSTTSLASLGSMANAIAKEGVVRRAVATKNLPVHPQSLKRLCLF